MILEPLISLKTKLVWENTFCFLPQYACKLESGGRWWWREVGTIWWEGKGQVRCFLHHAKLCFPPIRLLFLPSALLFWREKILLQYLDTVLGSYDKSDLSLSLFSHTPICSLFYFSLHSGGSKALCSSAFAIVIGRGEDIVLFPLLSTFPGAEGVNTFFLEYNFDGYSDLALGCGAFSPPHEPLLSLLNNLPPHAIRKPTGIRDKKVLLILKEALARRGVREFKVEAPNWLRDEAKMQRVLFGDKEPILLLRELDEEGLFNSFFPPEVLKPT